MKKRDAASDASLAARGAPFSVEAKVFHDTPFHADFHPTNPRFDYPIHPHWYRLTHCDG